MAAEPTDLDLRAVALSHVSGLAQRHGVLSWSQIAEGFEFRGEHVLLANKARGIFKPVQMRRGALSIKTTIPRSGRERRYDDQIASDEPFFTYRYQGTDPDAKDNRELRECLRENLPIIYFYGTEETLYEPIICGVVGEDRAALSFQVAPLTKSDLALMPVARRAATVIERQYGIVEVRQRLHQRKFRSAVLQAYGTRCAICLLRHPDLLDAAHIIADAEKLGEARVPNGIALCKLHHAAFDGHHLGIRPTLEISLSRDLLREKDGPMLEHGLRSFHGKQLHLPHDPVDEPDRKLVRLRWQEFEKLAG
jgi:putative restriction endonuclease